MRRDKILKMDCRVKNNLKRELSIIIILSYLERHIWKNTITHTRRSSR